MVGIISWTSLGTDWLVAGETTSVSSYADQSPVISPASHSPHVSRSIFTSLKLWLIVYIKAIRL